MSESRRSPFGKRILSYLVYAAVRVLETAVLSLTDSAAEGIARFASGAWFRLDRERRGTALENLRIAFGATLDEREREALARRAFLHAFRVVVDAIRRPRVLRCRVDLRRRVRYLEDSWELLGSAARGEPPGILLAGHFGNWELLASCAVLEGVRLSFVARSFGNPYLDRHVSESRGGSDAVILKDGAVRGVRTALDHGRWAGIVADQNAGLHGLYVEFFGVTASTYPLPAAIAVREGRPIYFVAAARRGPGFQYDLIVERHREPPTGDVDADVARCLRAFHAYLERLVRERPEQYFWLHRRWRTRPLGEPPGPHLPSYHRRGSRSRPAVP